MLRMIAGLEEITAGTISIGDTFYEKEPLSFTGIPNFAPELFRRAQLRDPLKMKQLQKELYAGGGPPPWAPGRASWTSV